MASVYRSFRALLSSPASGRRAKALVALALLFGAGTTVAAPGDNIALGKPVTMSGAPVDPTLQGANCTDGVTGGNYPANTICWTGQTQAGTNREWIEVDLGQNYIIDRVRLSNRSDGTNGDFARWIVVTTRPSTVAGVTANPQSTLDPAVNANAPFVNKLAYAAGNTTGAPYGTGQAAAWTSLNLQVGTHIARYVRIYTIKPNPTVLNLAEIEVFEALPPVRTIPNPGFEQPAIPAGSFRQVAETLVPGWFTTDPVAVPSAGFGTPFVDGGNIELWDTGFGGVTADSGAQFAELNAYVNGALSIAPLCVYPGETFQWRVSHRARGSAGDVDVARLRINGQNIATMSDTVTQAGTHTCVPFAGFNCSAQSGSPTTTGWGRWQGNWTSALAQPAAVTFEFAAISSASGSAGAGNFIDSVSITGLTAALEFGSATASGAESVPTANLPLLMLNGAVTAPQTVELLIAGGSAVRGVDYTTAPAAGAIVIAIPAGTYDGTAATAIALAPYIQIVADVETEDAETILLQLANPTAGLSLAGASGCRTGIAESTYTITDESVPTLSKVFAPDTIPYGGVATMTFLIDNSAPDASDRTVGFTDNLAVGLQIADPANAASSCGGTVSAAPGGNQIVVSGATVLAGQTCTITVGITNRPGFSGICYNPSFANENQNLAGLQNLIAQITQFTCVSITPPDCPDADFTNGFGNISGLTPELNNGVNDQCLAYQPNPRITIVKVPTATDGTVFPFTSTAPAPDDAFDLSSSTTLTQTFTVAPGTVSVTEGAVPNWSLTGIDCVNDAGSATFTYTGATSNPTSGFERGDDTANATLAFGDEVTCTYTNSPTALPTLAKYFNTDPASTPPPLDPPAIPRGGSALLTFVINNAQPITGNQSGLGFTDTLPPGLVLAAGDAPPSALVGANTCGGAVTAQAGTPTITLANGTVAANAECTFTVRVTTAP